MQNAKGKMQNENYKYKVREGEPLPYDRRTNSPVGAGVPRPLPIICNFPQGLYTPPCGVYMQNAKCRMINYKNPDICNLSNVPKARAKTCPLHRISRLTRNVQILRKCAVFPQKSGCNSVKYGHLSEIADSTLTRRVKLT